MEKIEEKTLLFAYFASVKEKDKLTILPTNNLMAYNKNFYHEIWEIKKKLKKAPEYLEAYLIIYPKAKKEKVKNEILTTALRNDYKYNPDDVCIDSYIRKIFSDFKSKSSIKAKFDTFGDIDFLILYHFSHDNDEDFLACSLATWHNAELPFLYGKQVLTEPIYLRYLNNRRIIANCWDSNKQKRFFLLEGGLKLDSKDDDWQYQFDFGLKNLNTFLVNDVDYILMNPVYVYGKAFKPYELYRIWAKILLYVLATMDVKWNLVNLKKVYLAFLKFIENEVCYYHPADETNISEKEFYQTWLNNYLKNYYMFIDAIKLIVAQEIKEKPREINFELPKYLNYLKDEEQESNYQKGVRFENAIEYLISNLTELKIMAKRAHNTREEIDISCCNLSSDEELWKLGAFIYIECKNWQQKVNVKIIRELGYIMLYKGHTTTILIAKNDLSKNAYAEIKRLALQEKYILPINLSELRSLQKPSDFLDLIKAKFQALEDDIANSSGLLG